MKKDTTKALDSALLSILKTRFLLLSFILVLEHTGGLHTSNPIVLGIPLLERNSSNHPGKTAVHHGSHRCVATQSFILRSCAPVVPC